MHKDRDLEQDFLGLMPRGEMAVVADTDDFDDAPETVPAPHSIPLIPHIRVATGRSSSR